MNTVTDLPEIIPSGTKVVISRGAYSSYEIISICTATRDVPIRELLKEYLERHPEEADDYKFNEDLFFNEVFLAGYFDEMPYAELHLGDYSKVSEVDVREVDAGGAKEYLEDITPREEREKWAREAAEKKAEEKPEEKQKVFDSRETNGYYYHGWY